MRGLAISSGWPASRRGSARLSAWRERGPRYVRLLARKVDIRLPRKVDVMLPRKVGIRLPIENSPSASPSSASLILIAIF